MTGEELVKFGKQVRKLAENPFQRQLEEARAEWKSAVYNKCVDRCSVFRREHSVSHREYAHEFIQFLV